MSIVDTAAFIAGSTNAVLNLSSSVVANTAATAAEAVTIAGFAKAVSFNTTDDLTDLLANVTGTVLTEARSSGFLTLADAAATVATALNTGNANLSYVRSSVEVIDTAENNLVLNADQLSNFLAGTVELSTGDALTVHAAAQSANLGTLSSYGGNGTLNLGAAVGTSAYTVNLGTSGVTTINLLGSGNHDVTTSASVVETFVLGADYNGGINLRGLSTGDVVDLDGGNGMTAFTLQQINAADVNGAGEWHFGSGVLTYFDDVATATISIGLVGITNIISENGDTFIING